MTTEEIIEHIERWLSHPGFSHITREFLGEAAQRLREQEVLIADLQKDRERVEAVEKELSVVTWCPFAKHWYVRDDRGTELRYYYGETWREAVDKAKEAKP